MLGKARVVSSTIRLIAAGLALAPAGASFAAEAADQSVPPAAATVPASGSAVSGAGGDPVVGQTGSDGDKSSKPDPSKPPPLAMPRGGNLQSMSSPNAPPSVLTPLSAVPDPNEVNITNGKARLPVPTLSIPAAPRLTFDLIQNNMPYVLANIGSGSPVASSISVHYGGLSAASFQCHDDDICDDRKATGAGLTGGIATGGPYTFTAPGSGAIYQFNLSGSNSGYGTGNWQVMYYASSVTYPDGEVITYSYDTFYYSGTNYTLHRLNKMSSNLGYDLTIAYQTTDGNATNWGVPTQLTIVKASNPSVPLARHIYTNNNVTDLAGRVYTCYVCDNRAVGQVELTAGSVTLPGDASPVKLLQGNGYVVSSVTRDGVGWSYAYSNFAVVNSPEGYSYNKLTVTGPAGYNQVYNITPGIDVRPNLIASSVDSIGRTTSYAYDVNNFRLTRMTMPEGNYVQIGYDNFGNVISKLTQPKAGSGQATLSESAAYDTAGCGPASMAVRCYRMLSYTDALGRTTNYTYDAGGRLTSETAPADSSGVRRVKYLSYSGSFTAPTQVRICGLGTTCGTNAEFKTQYTYVGATALPLTETQIDGVAGTSLMTTYSYDEAGRVLSADGPLAGTGDAKYFRYDVVGRKTWEIGPANANGTRPATRYTYRDSDDKVTVAETGVLPDAGSSALSVYTRLDTAYDARRNPRQVATSSGGTTYQVASSSHDDRGQLICSTVRMNQAAFGSLPADACALGSQGSAGPDRVTRNSYDAAGQLLVVQKAYGTSLQQNYVTYTYTSNGKQASVRDANSNLASLAYDGFDRQTRWSFPSKTSPGQVSTTDYEAYGYDAVGNRTSLRKRDGVTLGFQYDNLNRVRVKTVPASASGAAGYSVHTDYDVRGLQLYARFGSASGQGITNAYDGYGRLASTTSTMGGASRTISYQYDAAGAKTRLTHPGGAQFDMSYDAGSRMTGATWTGASGSGTFLGITYDGLGRRTVSSRVSSNAAYGYDPIGRLSSHNLNFANGSGNLAATFGYNPASQKVTRTASTLDYAFTGAMTLTRSYGVNGLNQYTSAGPASFGYDLNGNLTSDGTSSYVYDAENRLVSGGGYGASLAYDPLGRLWQVSSGSFGTTQFLYDGDQVAVEYDGGNGAIRRRYFWGPGVDEPVLQDEGGALNCSGSRFLQADEQGSIIAASNCSGNRTNANGYDEYGIPNAGNWGRYAYTGQAWLPELGMYYYKARIYSPTLGRFLQTDPIGYKDQINLYAYVSNDPVNKTDPTGLYNCDKKDCSTIKQFISAAKEAARTPQTGSLIPSSYNRALGAALSKLGKQGDNNGVTISLGRNESGAVGQTSSSGTSLGIDTSQLGKNFTVNGAITIAHEAVHSAYNRERGSSSTMSESLRRDRVAYGVESVVAQHYSTATETWRPGISAQEFNRNRVDSSRRSCIAATMQTNPFAPQGCYEQ